MQISQCLPARNTFKTSNICNIFQKLTRHVATVAGKLSDKLNNLSIS
jgi:hypothetical protein